MKTPSVRIALPLVLAALVGQGCVYVTQKVREEKELEVDQDGDGSMFAGPNADCDDLDPNRSPDFDEIPYDGIDNDCRGNADLVDQDGDGFPGITREEWEELTGRSADDSGPGGWPDVSEELDCLDVDLVLENGDVYDAVDVFPGNGAGEVPYDGIDSDCAGDNDFDLDGDEFIPDPLPGTGEDASTAYATYVELWGYEGLESEWFPNNGAPTYGDCDDGDAGTYPGNPDDAYYDGIDSNCDGANDFDPDGDGFMPPTLPDGGDTEPAFNAFVQRYDLEFTLPDEVMADPSDAKSPLVLGPFDDCLDLEDPRIGAAKLDAASIYPRAYSAVFGDNGDTPYDGIDTDCNRDNDFDQDRDAYNNEGTDSDYAEYVAFWGYEGEELRWAEVNPVVALASPGTDDCADQDPLTYPAALELIERDGVPLDQDCDGDENGSSFWFQGSQAAPVMEWKGLTNPRVIRLGDVYAIVLGARVLNQPGLGSPLSQNVGVAIPFPIDAARSQAVPAQPPYAWKGQSATQVVGPVTDVISLDRCRYDSGSTTGVPEELAYVYIEYVTTGAPSTFFSAYPLKEAVTGRSVTAPGLDIIGSVAPAMEANGVTMNLDGDCNVVVGAISDDALWVSHGEGQVVDLALYSDQNQAGSSIVASFDPASAAGASPQISFEVCETGVCADYFFDLDPTTTAAPQPPAIDPVLVTGGDSDYAVSNWSKTEDLVVTSIPFGGLGLDVTITPAGGGTQVLRLFDTDDVVSAYGQWHDGEIYVAAILEDVGGRRVVMAYGPPGDLDLTQLKYDPDDLPIKAAAAEPDQVALFVDDERIAVAMTMVDDAALATDNNDTVGWVFLGPPE